MDTASLYDIYLRHSSVSIDSRQLRPGDLFFALRGEHSDGNQYAAAALAAGAAYAIVDDPAVVQGDRYVLVADGLQALQDLARHHRRQFHIPILAITGSNGKTTTKELLAAVLGSHHRLHFTPGNYNNHIGLPLTLLSMPATTEIAVIEMGANAQGEIDLLCRIAEPTHGLVTNVGNAHLEGFGGFAGVIKGKGEMYRYLAETRGTAFVNLDEPHLADMAAAATRKVFYERSKQLSSAHPPLEVEQMSIHPTIQVAFLDECGVRTVADSHLSGQHNFQNVLTAVAVGKYFKVAGKRIKQALESYIPDNNRTQWLQRDGVRYLMDAYNANPTSMEAALHNFIAVAEAPRAIIIGDMLELGAVSEAEHQRIAHLANELPADRRVLVGKNFAQAASELGVLHFTDVAALRAWFGKQDWRGYTVLLKASRGIRLEQLL